MLLRIIREIWVSSDWFGCVFVISFYFAKVFSKSVTQSSPCFTIVWLFAISLSYAVDDIDGGESKVVSDLNESLGSRHFPTLWMREKVWIVSEHIWNLKRSMLVMKIFQFSTWVIFVVDGRLSLFAACLPPKNSKNPTRKFGISASNLCSFYSSLFFKSVSNFSLRDISAIKTNFEFSGPYGEIRGKTRAVC